MEPMWGRLYYEVDQMLSLTMSEDDYEDYMSADHAVTSFVPRLTPEKCRRMLEEVEHMYSVTTSGLERRRLFPGGLGFLAPDGSNFDPLMAKVELLLRDRLADQP